MPNPDAYLQIRYPHAYLDLTDTVQLASAVASALGVPPEKLQLAVREAPPYQPVPPPPVCPDLGWLRTNGLILADGPLWAMSHPNQPGVPPILTLANLTATTEAVLLSLFSSSDGAQIVADIKAQLALLGLHLAG